MARFDLHIIGAGRGGTSLLQALIAEHASYEVVSETLSQAFLLGRRRTFAENIGDPVARAGARVANFLHACEKAAARSGAERLAHKTTTEHLAGLALEGETRPPGMPLRHGALDWSEVALFAEAIRDQRVLFILRDGRSCVASKVRRTGQDPVEAARRWNYSVRVMEGLRSACSRFLLVRFEDLLRAPETTLIGVCRFLEVGFDQRMLHATSGSSMPIAYRRTSFDLAAAEPAQIAADTLDLIEENLARTGYLDAGPDQMRPA